MINDNNLLNQYCESKRIIRQAMKDNHLVLFVGAGASIASGMPSWSNAVRMIADRLSIKDDQLDFLRIPQYYYNSRGKKEYTQLIREIFRHGDYLATHEIHDRIIEFNTETIITTNYDHLIEQAAEENSQILSIVSKDADLPYRKGGKELIKMHGDFENDNFVLKEDDYLAYSRNFKLIENYIKSLIGTKVVLFIGYSFNDPDLKLVFSWVKDILGGDFQRAYLIESGKIYDVNEAEYFRNFGINVLYASIQLQDKFNSEDLTNNLLLMLKWLLASNDTDKLTSLNNELKPFLSMSYASQKYVKNAFQKIGIKTYGGALRIDDTFRNVKSDIKHIFMSLAYEQWVRFQKNVILSDDLLELLFHNIENKSEEEKIKLQQENNRRIQIYFKGFKPDKNEVGIVREILDVLRNSNMLYIEAHLPKEEDSSGWLTFIIPLDLPEVPYWMKYVNTFAFRELEKIAVDNFDHLSESRPDLYMEQGYIQFVLGNYLSAYNCYKNAKSIYYKHHEYINFFVAEFNRYIMGMMIIQGDGLAYGIDADNVKRIKEEYETINLDKMFNSLPNLGETNKALKDLYTFNVAYSLFQDAYTSSEKVIEQAKTQYVMFSGVAAFSGMRESISDYYNYISLNMLPVNNYTEHISIFRIYFQSIVNSAMSYDEGNTIDAAGRLNNVHVEELQDFDILVALKFVEEKALNKALHGFSNNLPLSGEALNYIIEVVKNCTRRQPQSLFLWDNTFWKCIVILSKSNLNVSVVDAALEKLVEIAAGMDFRAHSNEIIRFIDNANNQDTISAGSLDYLDDFICKIFDFLQYNKQEALPLRSLLTTILWVSREQGRIFDKSELIKPLINDESRLLCVVIYPFIGENSKKLIKDTYSSWKIESRNQGFEFYYALVDDGIIKPDAQAEKEIFDYYNETDADISDFEGIISLPLQDDNNFLYQLLDLYIKELIIDKDSCKDLIIKKNVVGAEWLMDYKGYDYSKFDVNWLTLCTDKLLGDICNDVDVKNKIRLAVENEYIAGNAKKKVVDIYFKHLAGNGGETV